MTIMYSAVVLVLSICVAIVYSERDPDCSPHQFHEDRKCCSDIPMLFPDSNHKSIMETCGMRGKGKGPGPGPGPGPGGDPEEADCAAECVLKAHKLITDDGHLDSDAFTALAKSSFTDSWATVGVEAVQKCIQTAASDVDANSKCKSGAHHMMHCVKKQMFLSCPEAHWTATPECQSAKTRMEKCEPPKRHP
ncbi:Hypothetical protein NTJ_07689 [Nesidiocoris tenuis]|uniref:Uncharacterized protein n=1 Tax=Nesidiocoris tenuis TaxID=355587 RepID=A0ABN7ARP7_9HEMI|nr:Hypothetical protein NTJ_07689 [Nesidiocoris tenuis]